MKHAPETRMEDTFARWLSDGKSWIGVFENMALDSANHGHRIALPYDQGDWDKATIEKDRAPDSPSGMGWRYILAAKCKTVEEAIEAMGHAEEKTCDTKA